MKKIETLAEYQQLASRTCPDLGTLNDNILHMQLGIVTEVGESLDIFKKKHAYKKEMDLVNLGEELADKMWYIANYALITKDSVFTHLELDILQVIVKDSFVIPATYDKKFATTVNILTSLLKDLLTTKPQFINYISAIAAVCQIWELDFMQILTNNIAKLQVRYPEKFTEEAALNRDLEAERKELEKVSQDENTESRV